MSVDKILDDIWLSISNYFTDMDKLCFMFVCKNFYKFRNKLWFDTDVDLNTLRNISYRNRFRSVRVKFDELHLLSKPTNIKNNYYLSDMFICLPNLISVTVVIYDKISNGDHIFTNEDSKIIEKLNIQKLTFINERTHDSIMRKYFFNGPLPKCVKILTISNKINGFFSSLPSTLEELYTSEHNNFLHIKIDSQLKKLSFNKIFITQLNLPEGLTHLNGLICNLSSAIPKSIVSLSMDIHHMRCDIISSVSSLVDLKINNVKSIECHSIPNSVKKLTINGYVDIKNDIFPDNLSHLTLSGPTLTSLNILPLSLTYFKIENKIFSSADFIYELCNLTRLEIYISKYNPLDFSKLPKKITHLSTNIFEYKSQLQPNITNLSIKSNIKNDRMEYLSPAIIKLKICKYHDLAYVPSTVQKLCLEIKNYASVEKIFQQMSRTVHSLKLINTYLKFSLPEHITTFKLIGTVDNLQLLHRNLCRLKISKSNKKIITGEMRSKIRISYYDDGNVYI